MSWGKGSFAFRLAWWQLRGQSSRAWLFVFCVAIGVAARVSVGSFMGQVSQAVNREARSLLGADLEVSGGIRLPADKYAELKNVAGPAARLQEKASFLSVVSSGRHSRLCQLSAIEEGYPFYGKFRVSHAGGLGLHDTQPAAYVGPELLPQLGLNVGDSVKIGRLRFVIAGLILEEPGVGGGAFSLGPRVLISLRHFKATGLDGFGSRISYSTLLALPDPALAEPLKERLNALWQIKADPGMPGPPPSDSFRVRTYKDAEGNIRRFFERLADFLNLASLMALLLGGIGVASVVRAFVREQYASIGVLRTLGASSGFISRIYLYQCLGLGALGGVLGAALGTLTQNMLPLLLKDFLPVTLKFGIDLKACLTGIGLGLMTSALFSLLPIFEIRQVHPAELFRDGAKHQSSGWRFWITAGAGALIFIAIGALEARSLQRGGGFVAALIAGALMIWFLGGLILPRLAALRFGSVGLRHGFSNLARPGLRPTASVIALGCAALNLGVLSIYQGSLLGELDSGRRSQEIPGLFLIDIQSDQVNNLKQWIEARGNYQLSFSPMVKGRYWGKNGGLLEEKKEWSREEEDAQRMRNREQNLSYRPALARGEKIVKGVWMDPQGTEVEASLEERFAERLGADIGDRLRFDVQGVQVEAKVTSLRKVHWASFQPNFFVLLSPWALQDAPAVWIGSVAGLKDKDREALQTDLVEQFSNVTVFDVAEGSKKLMGIMEKISWAIRAVALFSLLTGLVVLAGIALSTARARQQESALLKTLGAGRRQILSSLAAEFASLGALSGFLGLGLSVVFAWFLLAYVIEIPFKLPVFEFSLLFVLLCLVCAVTGMLASLKAIRVKPLAVLREE